MASIQVIVRHTFLDIAEPKNGSFRRCGSTPAPVAGVPAKNMLDFSFNEGGETRLSSASTATSRGFSPKTRRSVEVFSMDSSPGHRQEVSSPRLCKPPEDSTGGTCSAVVPGGDSGSTLGHRSQATLTPFKLGGDEEDENKKPTIMTQKSVELKTAACNEEDLPPPVAPLLRHPPEFSALLTQDQRLRQLNALDLCDTTVPLLRPSARSTTTARGPAKPLQPRRPFAAEIAAIAEPREFLFGGCLRTSPKPPKFLFGGCLRNVDSSTRRRSLPDDESPFTSDEEHLDSAPVAVKPVVAATPSRLLDVVDVKEWPDTDDEFEKSMALDGTVAVAHATSQPQQVFPTWTADGEVLWQPCHPCAARAPCAAPAPTPLRLNRDAKMFSPAPPAVAEFKAVVANLKLALLSTLHVLGVDVKEDEGSSCATLLITLIDSSDFATEASATIQSAKEGLLSAAALTKGTYVFGFATEGAFRGIVNGGFEATLAHCPAHKEEKACWDTFQKGACPRQGTCRWYHPRESDKRKIRVVIDED